MLYAHTGMSVFALTKDAVLIDIVRNLVIYLFYNAQLSFKYFYPIVITVPSTYAC